jgi:Rod binding domain-containing protein
MKIPVAKYMAIQPEPIANPNAKTGASAAASPELLKLRKACREFEAIFISFMLKSMRDATPESGLFGEGLGSQVYSDIFDAKLAEKMAESGNMRIGDILFDQYSSLIENAKPAQTPIGPSTTVPKPKIENEAAALPPQPPPKPDTLVASKTPLFPPLRLNLPKVVDTEIKRPGPLTAYEDTIQAAASKFGLSPELLKAVIQHESGGNPRAVSPDGAKGLMQLLDSTAKMLGVSDPFNPVQNIMGGAKYLAQLVKRFGGDLEKTLASYNAGPGAVEKYNGVPPFKETRNYVEKVLGTMRIRND